jgi:hypothetical protein
VRSTNEKFVHSSKVRTFNLPLLIYFFNCDRLGFHYPPFNSVQHLHLHAISPASSMSFVSRLIFRPGSWWFVSVSIHTSAPHLSWCKFVLLLHHGHSRYLKYVPKFKKWSFRSLTNIRGQKIRLPAGTKSFCLATIFHFVFGSWVLEFWQLYVATCSTVELVDHIQWPKIDIVYHNN